MEKQPELTICSVYYSAANKKLLELNWDLVNKLNPDKNWVWLVADNTPPELGYKIDGKKFQLVEGARQEDLPGFIRPWMRGSYHHTLAVNSSIKHIKTRFALFLDIDFYIVRPEWVREIIGYMKKNNLAFFGVPWHPRHIKKYRYFPAIHSLFVDLDKVPKNALNFLPQYEEMLKPSFWTKITGRIRKAAFRFLSEDRRQIGQSYDSGYAIFKRYKDDKKIKVECPKPVFKPELDLKEYPIALARYNRVMEKFLPDRLCFVPKKKDYYTNKSFSAGGYFDAAGMGWEEFIWQGKPFGFHMRGSYRLKNDLEDGIAFVRRIIEGRNN